MQFGKSIMFMQQRRSAKQSWLVIRLQFPSCLRVFV